MGIVGERMQQPVPGRMVRALVDDEVGEGNDLLR